MKTIFCFFIIAIGIVSCKTSMDNAFLQPKENIHAILDSFVRENNINNYVYELYVDKETSWDYILTIYCGEKSLTKEENDYNGHIPLNYTIVSGKRFYIYSGIEHYFKRGSDTVAADAENDYVEKIIWVLKDSANVISVYKGIQFMYPFVPLPMSFPHEIFTPPND